MILCNKQCKLYDRCNVKHPMQQQCVFDMGIYEEEDNDDEFLEKMTY